MGTDFKENWLGDFAYCKKWTERAVSLSRYGLLSLQGLEKGLHGNRFYNPEEVKLRLMQRGIGIAIYIILLCAGATGLIWFLK